MSDPGRLVNRFAPRCATLFATAWLTGCASLQGYPTDPEAASTLPSLQTSYFGPHADDAYNGLTDPTARKAKRDEIVNSRIRVYDLEFSHFERALNANGAGLSIGSDLTVLTLNGLGATTGGAAAKSALAAASAGVVGAQGAVNKDLYYQKTLPAIIAQMQANRQLVKLAIYKGLGQTDVDYSLSRAESDLIDLGDAGSLPNAINNITQKATDQKNAADALIQSLHTLTFATTDSATKIRAWLYPSGAIDVTHVTALQAWLNAQPEPYVHSDVLPVASFVSADTKDAKLEPIRQRAMVDPNLSIPH